MKTVYRVRFERLGDWILGFLEDQPVAAFYRPVVQPSSTDSAESHEDTPS